MKGYYFNQELFKRLNVALEMTVKGLSQKVGVPESTWRTWRRGKDVPLATLMKVCNALHIPAGHFICAGDEKDVLVGQRHYVKNDGSFREVVFLNQALGEEVTTVQGRQVMDLCQLVGISAATFYDNFRNRDYVSNSYGTQAILNICNKTKTYPMDFLLSDGVDVPVLEGYQRKAVPDAEALAKRNIDILSHNARLSRELDKEKEKVRELKGEVERLKKALRLKRTENARLEEELDSRAMRAAEGSSRVDS